MKKFCDKPDRDEPKLKCGYPMPCPHHTVIADLSEIAAGAIPTIAWLSHYPTLSIGHVIIIDGGGSRIGVRAIALWAKQQVWIGTRDLPLSASMAMLRDATDELTREGHLALEAFTKTAPEGMRPPAPLSPVAKSSVRRGSMIVEETYSDTVIYRSHTPGERFVVERADVGDLFDAMFEYLSGA